MMHLLFYALIFVNGILSMGFQIVAARELAPYFGASIIVWSFLISTFLIAFSAGSFFGGAVSTRPRRVISMAWWSVSALTVLGFAVNALARRPILRTIETGVESIYVGLGVACAALFLVPVLALTSLTPICVEFVSQWKSTERSGRAAGLVYGVSTLGNIVGVMLTALVLVPHFSLSTILYLWTVAASVALGVLCWVLQSSFAGKG